MIFRYKKEIILFVASSFFALTLALLLAESYFQKLKNPLKVTQFDTELGWSNIPNSSIKHNGIVYSANSLGWRSSEINWNRKRITLIGDSVTFGTGVNDNETVSHYLEEKLKKYQSLNLGVPGYGIDQSYLNLKKHIEFIKPKWVVVIIFSGNDIVDITKSSLQGKSKPLFTLPGKQMKFKMGPNFNLQMDPTSLVLTGQPVSKYSCVNLLSMSAIVRNTFLYHRGMNWCDLKSLDKTETNHVMEGLILGIHETIIKNNAKPLFVISPSQSDFKYKNTIEFLKKYKEEKNPPADWGNKKSLIFFQSLLKKLNVEHIDHYQNLLKKENEDLRGLYVDFAHYSAKGNILLANAIADYIRKSES
jgi:lysophospholipase L1-like esterase